MFFALAEWVSSVLLLLVLSLVCAFVMATEQGPQNQSQGQGPSRLHALSLKSLKRTHDMFFANAHTSGEAHDTQDAQTARLAAKIASEYGHVKHLPFAPVAPSVPAKRPRLDAPTSAAQDTEKVSDNVVSGQAQDQGAEGGEESLGKLVVALDVQVRPLLHPTTSRVSRFILSVKQPSKRVPKDSSCFITRRMTRRSVWR